MIVILLSIDSIFSFTGYYDNGIAKFVLIRFKNIFFHHFLTITSRKSNYILFALAGFK